MEASSLRVINGDNELAPIDSVRPHPRNPRQGDVGAIHESITANGFYGAIIAQKRTGYILAGNHRWQAAQAAGATEIPVTWLDVDDDHALRILLADNRTNDLASYDTETLAQLLREIHADTGSLLGTGYDGDDLDELLAELEPPQAGDAPEAQVDKADELREKWGTAPGQLWVIGRHRLLCGDSTERASWERLMQGQQAHLLHTDPPYGVAAIGGGRDPRDKKNFHSGNAIENDADVSKALEVTAAALAHARTALAPGSSFYIWHASTFGYLFSRVTEEALGKVRSVVVWAKDNFVFGRQDYHWQHEPCLYGWTEGAAHRWFGSRDQGTVWRVEAVGADLEKKLHPTAKPLGLAARAIENSSKRGEIVVDPFAGAGSTIIAAHQADRVSYALEYEPKYVAVILERLADLGLTPELTDA